MNNNLFFGRYFLERLLGRGNFSEVWLAKDDKIDDVRVALKIYAPATGLDDYGLNILAREFSIVLNANHKNLLKPIFYDTFERRPFLVLPYCKNGSIQKNVGKFTEEEAWKLLRDVASGLAYLHDMPTPLIHQDIKPDNIMVGDKGDYMITDFGVSTHGQSVLRKSVGSNLKSAGTTAYMAPERFSSNNTPIPANDVWSLGAMTYEMLIGDVPFTSPAIEGGILQKNGAEIPNLPDRFSPELNKIIRKCLIENPLERPTAQEVERYAQIAIDGGNPFSGPEPLFVKYKNPLIVLACSLVLLLSVIFVLLNKRPIPNDHDELTGIAKATELMKVSTTAQEGLGLLTELAGQQDVAAIYLLSRLYFGKLNSEYDPDSIRLMRQVLQDTGFQVDFQKAHDLLLQTIEVDPKDYHALYELGRDCLAGINREHEKDLDTEDFRQANDYFTKALEYAKEANDGDYEERINEQIEMIKTVI